MSDLSTAERLLAAAIEFIDAGGEVAVRVDAVAEAAAVRRPSVYHYFGDRDGLIIAAQAERYRRTLLFGMADQVTMVRRCSSRAEFQEVLRLWMMSLSGPDGIARRKTRIEVLGSAVSRPKLRRLIEVADDEAAEGIAELIRVAQDRGWTGDRFDPEAAAFWWFGMMNGRYLVEGERTDALRQAWDELATEAVLRLFGGAD